MSARARFAAAGPLAGGVALAAIAVFAWRAWEGLVAGLAYARAQNLVFIDQDEAALPLFERAQHGELRLRALQDAADIRIRMWDTRLVETRGAQADPAPLVAAAREYLEYLCRSPAAWEPWEGLARAYYRVEEAPLVARETAPPPPPDDPWSGIGRSGRLAIGMLRRAIERAPRWYSNYDTLAIRLGRYGLEDEALRVVRESARVMPLFSRHHYRLMPDIPPALLDAFAEGVRSTMDGPLLMTRMDLLLGLGRIEQERHDLPAAERALRQALEESGDALNHAEAWYLLGNVLFEARRYEQAQQAFEKAAEHPAFETAALSGLAALARQMDQPEEALALLRRLSRRDPSNVDYILQMAEVARRVEDWPAAVEALKWAVVVRPDDGRARVALIETYLEMNDVAAASIALRELRRQGEASADLDGLERRIELASQSGLSRRFTESVEPGP